MEVTAPSNGVIRAALANPAFSLVVPAHNEGERIGHSLTGYLDAFPDGEIIVVCNGCTDGTEVIARNLARDRDNLRVISITHAIGKGGAVRAGFLAARAPLIGYVDADGATAPSEIRRLFGLVRDDVDAVIASRWTTGAYVAVAQPFQRRLASRAFNLIVRLLFGLPYHDTQCGAKVFRAESLREIANALEVANFAFDIDVLHALRTRGRKILEVPTEWRDVAGSTVNLPRTSVQMLLALIRLRLRYSLFRYVIPLFDRLWPTKPLRVRNGLAILIMNWRDPKHPQAGGAERYLLEVAKRLAARGNRVEWLTAGFKGSSEEDVIDGITIHRVGNRFSVYLLLPLYYLRRFRDRFDAIIDAENGIPFFSPFFSLKPKVCLVFHVHQKVFRRHLRLPLSALLCWVEAALMPFAYGRSRFIAISGDTRAELRGLGVSSNHIDLAISGVDDDLRPMAKASRPTIAYVGRLKPYKRIELLIDAVPAVVEKFPELVVRIAGTGDHEAALRERAKRLGVADRIVFEGFVDEARKAEILGSAWLFVMPSEMEGWGLTITEAAACGTASIGYDIPGVREAIVDGKTGFILANEAPLADAISRLVGDAALRERLSDGALAASAAYSWDRTTDAVAESLRHAVLQETGHMVCSDGAGVALEKDSLVNVFPKSPLESRRSRREST